jgi:mRNA-degrading endonuclease toxin of MazEF toxin-antitoxin module
MPRLMTGFERFDVLTALFPFIDIPVHKPRPVLVLSGVGFNVANGHVVVAMITTGAGSRWPSDCPILDLTAAGLGHPSIVRCKLFTVPNAQIGRKIGHLSDSDRARIGAHLDAILCGAVGPAP